MTDLGIQAITTAILLLGIGGALLYLRSYVGKKAEGLATREDAAALTREIERAKLTFAERASGLHAVLSRDVAVHGVRFQTEFRVYGALWKEIRLLKLALDRYRITRIASENKPDLLQEAHSLENQLDEGFDRLTEHLEEWDPFLPLQVHVAFLEAQVAFKQVQAREIPRGGVDRDYLLKDVEVVNRAMDAVTEAVRKRLFEDAWLAESLAEPTRQNHSGFRDL